MNAITRMIRMSSATAAFALLTACATTDSSLPDSYFQPGPDGAPQPWTHERFDAADDKFTFAVFSDLTGGEREGVFDIAVAQLNLLRPEFIINVGDLIEGDTDRVVVDRQWDSFDDRARSARAPVFYVGGNHDLLGQTLQEAWADRVGPTYYHFVYRDVLFLVLNTDDFAPERLREIAALRREAIEVGETQGWDVFAETEYARLPENSAGHVSAAQSEYFLDVIERNEDVRWTFLFMHKAPWKRTDLESFAAIEAALANRPYTVFHGHEHAYRYQQRNGRDYIQLATTGGVPLPDEGQMMDQVVLVTVDDSSVDIANLKMSGILDRTGKIPLNGEDICSGRDVCEADEVE